jgi:MtN3 and saliva related transmembrane protein
MTIDIATIIGSTAATLTTLCFIPQVVKILHTKNTEGISLCMYIVFATGVSLWFIYGIMLHSYPMIISNIITFLLVVVILVYTIKHRK